MRELLEQGRAVAVVVREPAASRDRELRAWLREHGVDPARLVAMAGDLTGGAGLGLNAADDQRLQNVRDVFNAAAIYRFGLERKEAHAANVQGALNVLHWAATRPGLRRLIHVSGYRVGLDPQPRYPIPEAELAKLYESKGAYEASKTEGDAAVRVVAAQLGVPLTVVNPSSVIGHSTTGEAGQYIGLAELVRDLWMGRLPALAGNARTFVPVVTVDHFARFMAAIPEHDKELQDGHWVLDERTPELPDLVRLLAAHMGVRAPKAVVPVGVVRRLPPALTRANPETLAFLTEDHYDTQSADRVAEAARRTARRLRAANRPAERAALQVLLRNTTRTPVQIVAGQLDPLIDDPGPATLTIVPNTALNPQLTHPAAIAAITLRH